MVAHFTMRTHGVKQAFRFVEGIWLLFCIAKGGVALVTNITTACLGEVY